MELSITKTDLTEIKAFRTLFLHESNFQFICNKCHDYGWADIYLFMINGASIGYGSVWGTDKRQDRDTIFEFFIIKPFRKFSDLIFTRFCTLSNTIMIESQSNDLPLSEMMFKYSKNIQAEAILFEDSFETNIRIPRVTFRKKQENDEMGDDDSEYVLEKDGLVVASGGLMLNYNIPYADIYMQVKEPFRKQGLGSLIVQELKREAYLMKRVPAARCNVNNQISKATLLKAGFKICGYRMKGNIIHPGTLVNSDLQNPE